MKSLVVKKAYFKLDREYLGRAAYRRPPDQNPSPYHSPYAKIWGMWGDLCLDAVTCEAPTVG